MSCKVFLNELSPRQHLVETLWVGLDLHVRQILEKELDIISGRKVVCLCCFHNAVDHCAGFCAGRRVAEQPVLSADCKGVDSDRQKLKTRKNWSLFKKNCSRKSKSQATQRFF